MCGRYTVFTEDEIIELREIINEVNQRYINTVEHAAMKQGEICPTNIAPVLTQDGALLMKWGFPKWDGSGVVINARAESAAEKSMFRSSLFARRCIIPSTGFYEWSHGTGKKDKYLLRLPSLPMLYMAGFYNSFKDEQGKISTAYVILTTAANESVAPIHDRMPVILYAEEKDAWIMEKANTQELISRKGPELVLEQVG